MKIAVHFIVYLSPNLISEPSSVDEKHRWSVKIEAVLFHVLGNWLSYDITKENQYFDLIGKDS